mgnify:CR=1 FL=1
MGAGASLGDAASIPDGKTAQWTELVKLGIQYSGIIPKTRYNTLLESPADAKFKLCVVQFKVPGAKNGGSDKGPDGNRVDSIPIANSVIKAGGACDLLLYDSSGETAAENTDAETGGSASVLRTAASLRVFTVRVMWPARRRSSSDGASGGLMWL